MSTIFQTKNSNDYLKLIAGFANPVKWLQNTESWDCNITNENQDKRIWCMQPVNSDMTVTLTLEDGTSLSSITLTQDMTYNLAVKGVEVTGGTGYLFVWEA